MNIDGYEKRIDNLIDMAKRNLSKEEFEELLRKTNNIIKMYQILINQECGFDEVK